MASNLNTYSTGEDAHALCEDPKHDHEPSLKVWDWPIVWSTQIFKLKENSGTLPMCGGDSYLNDLDWNETLSFKKFELKYLY